MRVLLTVMVIVSLFTGCLKGEEPSLTCTYNECNFVAPATEIQQVRDYLTANNITATQHCSGLFYIIDEPGTGTKPTVCNNISFTYEGKLTNGTVFDKSATPIVFNLNELITGFKNGIPLLKAGGSMRLYVPPSLGYGNRQSGSIPPNSVLIFTVTLVGVQ